ncbi:MAG TPA: flagellar motor switch protein FliN [Firmicutes bacterium]|nr:flagellar motor switch protein FliN [Bacillota bacterium]
MAEAENGREKTGRLELIKNIPVEISAVLGDTTIPLKKVVSLVPGETLSLDRLDGEPIKLYANECLVGQGEVVLVNGRFGIRITYMAFDQ